jgi:hypothetical protein
MKKDPSSHDESPLACPYCGAWIPQKASACPYCGSDEETGWSDDTYLDGIDLDDDFEYAQAHRREFGGGWAFLKQRWRVALVAVVVLVVFVVMVLLR